jgi:hypothetical protein
MKAFQRNNSSLMTRRTKMRKYYLSVLNYSQYSGREGQVEPLDDLFALNIMHGYATMQDLMDYVRDHFIGNHDFVLNVDNVVRDDGIILSEGHVDEGSDAEHRLILEAVEDNEYRVKIYNVDDYADRQILIQEEIIDEEN